MARSLLFLSSRFILILLLCYSLSPISIWQNQIPSGESLFLSLKLDSRVFPSRNNGPRKANGAVLPPCLKAKASLFVLEVGLSTLFLLMLAGDVSTNPGPQTVRPGSQGIGENSSFVSLTSDEESASMDDTVEFHNDSDDSSQNDLSPDGFDYFNLHLGHKGIRFGSWNVNRLTTTKLEQIKLFLLNEDGRPRLDILSINETFLKPLLPDCLYSVPGFTVDRRLLEIRPPSVITRVPRSVEHNLKFWKATEYRNWLFLYSLPCMKGVLDDEYYQHYTLLVGGIVLLSGRSISPEQLELAGNLLIHFVEMFYAYYAIM